MLRTTRTHHLARLLSIAAVLAFGAGALADEIHVPGDYPMIQMAIGLAEPGDVIIVAPGEYLEHIDLMGKAITLRSTDPTDPDVVTNTVLLGILPLEIITCVTGEGPDTVINGFVVTHLNPIIAHRGMSNIGTSPTVMNCTFTRNIAPETSFGGGGMYNNDASPTVENCTFTENSAGTGGGMLNIGGSPTVINCFFLNNTAEGDAALGGAMANSYSDVTVTDCTFYGNTAMEGDIGSGGGMYNGEGTQTLTRCTFAYNIADFGGGIFNYSGADLTLTNTTVCANTPDQVYGSFTDGGGNALSTWPAPPLPLPDTPEPTGACCLDGGVCMNGTLADCLAAGGTYLGHGSECESFDCPDFCPEDINGDLVIDILDLLAVLASWGPCP